MERDLKNRDFDIKDKLISYIKLREKKYKQENMSHHGYYFGRSV